MFQGLGSFALFLPFISLFIVCLERMGPKYNWDPPRLKPTCVPRTEEDKMWLSTGRQLPDGRRSRHPWQTLLCRFSSSAYPYLALRKWVWNLVLSRFGFTIDMAILWWCLQPPGIQQPVCEHFSFECECDGNRLKARWIREAHIHKKPKQQ